MNLIWKNLKYEISCCSDLAATALYLLGCLRGIAEYTHFPFFLYEFNPLKGNHLAFPMKHSSPLISNLFDLKILK